MIRRRSGHAQIPVDKQRSVKAKLATVNILASMMRLPAFVRRHKALFAILGLGLAVRLAVLLYYLSTHGWQAETWEYEIIARNLLAGRGFTIEHNNALYSSFVVPVFPLVCALLHLIGGSGFAWYYVFHLSTAAGIMVLTYAIAHRWYGVHTAGLAALLVALEPGLIVYYAYKVDVVALSTFLLLLGVYLFAVTMDTWNRSLAVLVGLVAGIGVLTRPDLIGFLVIPAAWIIAERKRFQEACWVAALILFATIVVMTPWFVRNYHLHGKFALTTITGETLWIGNNPNATGTAVTLDNKSQLGAAPEEFRNKVYSLQEFEQDAFFKEQAFNYIAADPVGFLSRALAKIYYFWWFSPTFAWRHYDWVPSPLIVIYRILYGLLLGFGVYGVWVGMRGPRDAIRRVTLYLLALPMAIAIIHSINFVEGRHRVLVMPIILLFAAHGMMEAIGKHRSLEKASR